MGQQLWVWADDEAVSLTRGGQRDGVVRPPDGATVVRVALANGEEHVIGAVDPGNEPVWRLVAPNAVEIILRIGPVRTYFSPAWVQYERYHSKDQRTVIVS